jgi:hypothetical protein
MSVVWIRGLFWGVIVDFFTGYHGYSLTMPRLTTLESCVEDSVVWIFDQDSYVFLISLICQYWTGFQCNLNWISVIVNQWRWSVVLLFENTLTVHWPIFCQYWNDVSHWNTHFYWQRSVFNIYTPSRYATWVQEGAVMMFNDFVSTAYK